MTEITMIMMAAETIALERAVVMVLSKWVLSNVMTETTTTPMIVGQIVLSLDVEMASFVMASKSATMETRVRSMAAQTPAANRSVAMGLFNQVKRVTMETKMTSMRARTIALSLAAGMGWPERMSWRVVGLRLR